MNRAEWGFWFSAVMHYISIDMVYNRAFSSAPYLCVGYYVKLSILSHYEKYFDRYAIRMGYFFCIRAPPSDVSLCGCCFRATDLRRPKPSNCGSAISQWLKPISQQNKAQHNHMHSFINSTVCPSLLVSVQCPSQGRSNTSHIQTQTWVRFSLNGDIRR